MQKLAIFLTNHAFWWYEFMWNYMIKVLFKSSFNIEVRHF